MAGRPGRVGRRKSEPGGWNRFVLEVDDLAALVATLKQQGVRFRLGLEDGGSCAKTPQAT